MVIKHHQRSIEMTNYSKFTASDILDAYEQTSNITRSVYIALQQCRKYGFRMCQYKSNTPEADKEYYAAIFWLSLCHGETIVSKIDITCPEFRSSVKEAIQRSEILKNDIDFLLSYSPLIDWNGGG